MDDSQDKPTGEKKEISVSLLKGFAAGVILSHINKNLILGLVVGTLGGCYIQQNYSGMPDVSKTAKEWLNTIREAMKKKSNWSNPCALVGMTKAFLLAMENYLIGKIWRNCRISSLHTDVNGKLIERSSSRARIILRVKNDGFIYDCQNNKMLLKRYRWQI